jgi:outer membrane protein assembly factor BamB
MVNLTVLASILLFAIWFLIFGGWRWYVRLGLTILGFAALFGGTFVLFRYIVDVRGVTGDWKPKFTWKWTPRADYRLAVEPKAETPTVAPATLNELPDFAAFLGTDGSNHLSGIGLDPDWENHPPREVWRRTGDKGVGPAWSSFAVSRGRAVTQEQRGDYEMVTCYNLADGSLLWSHKDQTRFSEFQGGDGPRATPTIVGNRVFTMGAKGLLNCLDLETGNSLWKSGVNVLTDSPLAGPVPVWAKSNSPLVFDQSIDGTMRQLVVVSLGEDRSRTDSGGLLSAYDGNTGQRVWTNNGGDWTSYATPILTTLGGAKQIVSVNAQSVTAHDPATGNFLWSHQWGNGMAKCSQPVPVGDDRLFLSQGYHAGAQLIKIEKKGSLWTPSQLWENKDPKVMRTTFSNVVVYKDHVYGLDDGVLQCIELNTGVKKWRDGRYRYGQVMGVDDLLIVQAEDGKVVLVAADPEKHRELGQIDALHDKTWNPPALVGKYLLVRNAEEAVCYELPLKAK